MPGIAGKLALIKVSGTATPMTAQATTNAGDDKNYQITLASRRILDRTVATVVKVATVPTVEAYTLDRLRGRVTFATVDAGRGAVTIDSSYLPMSTAAKAKAFSWNVTAQNVEDSDFETVQANGGMVTRTQALKDVSGTIHRRWSTNTYFTDALVAGVPVAVEFYLNAAGTPDMICWALLNKSQAQAAVDGIAEEDVEFQGTTDADGRAFSLS